MASWTGAAARGLPESGSELIHSSENRAGQRTSGSETEAGAAERLMQVVDQRTREILERRRLAVWPKNRSWLLRRLLLSADLLALALAYLLALAISGGDKGLTGQGRWVEYAIFLASLPLWVVGAKLFGLYDEDESRTDHSTLDDLTRVFLLVTLGAFALGLVTGFTQPNATEVLLFWIFGILLVTAGRLLARGASRRTLAYVQNAVIVGAGDVGQLVARKLVQHPEYGINFVGFVDS